MLFNKSERRPFASILSVEYMEKIRNTVNKFANSFDLKDWEGLKSVLASEVECDYTSLRGVKETATNDNYVSLRIKALNHLKTHHLISNHQITVEGRVAKCVASAMIWRFDGNQFFNTHAIYTFLIREQNGDWKICSIKQDVLWNEGEPSIHAGTK